MEVLRAGRNTMPGAKAILQDPSQQGFCAARRRLPRGDRGPRAGLERARPEARQRSWSEIATSGLVTDIDSDYLVGMPEVRVFPDRDRAADLGVSMAESGRPSRGHRRRCASASSRTGGGGTTSACGSWLAAAAAEGHPAPLRPHGRGRPRAPGRHRAHRASPPARDHPQGARARHRDLRERRPGIAGPGRASPADRGGGPARWLPRHRRRQRARRSRRPSSPRCSRSCLGVVVAYMVLATQFNAFTHPFTGLLALPFTPPARPGALDSGPEPERVPACSGLACCRRSCSARRSRGP